MKKGNGVKCHPAVECQCDTMDYATKIGINFLLHAVRIEPSGRIADPAATNTEVSRRSTQNQLPETRSPLSAVTFPILKGMGGIFRRRLSKASAEFLQWCSAIPV